MGRGDRCGPSPHGERVLEDLYAQVAQHDDDRALATLAMPIGQVNYFVPLALVGKPLPSRPPTEQGTPVSA